VNPVDKYIQDQLEESVFSSNPAKRRQAFSRLRMMLDQPLPAAKAVEKIKKYADDQKLLNDISYFAQHAPDADMRPILKKRMKELSAAQGK